MKRIALQMAEGLRYLEKFNFIHYRLSLDAFFITYSFNIKLSIYGMSEAKLLSTDEKLDDINRCRWMSPESLPASILPTGNPPEDRVPYNNQGMVYTFGSCLYSVFHEGALPHEDEPPENIRDRRWRMENLPVLDVEALPKEVTHMCLRCWRKPSERPGFKEIKNRLKKIQDSYHF